VGGLFLVFWEKNSGWGEGTSHKVIIKKGKVTGFRISTRGKKGQAPGGGKGKVQKYDEVP